MPVLREKDGVSYARANCDLAIRRRIITINQFHKDDCPGYAIPKFTGFDGIPDWTPERQQIAELTKVIEYGANKNLELTNRIEDLKKLLAAGNEVNKLLFNKAQELADWKKSALESEKLLDVQKVAEALDLKIGAVIDTENVMMGINNLKDAEKAALEGRERLRGIATRLRDEVARQMRMGVNLFTAYDVLDAFQEVLK